MTRPATKPALEKVTRTTAILLTLAVAVGVVFVIGFVLPYLSSLLIAEAVLQVRKVQAVST